MPFGANKQFVWWFIIECWWIYDVACNCNSICLFDCWALTNDCYALFTVTKLKKECMPGIISSKLNQIDKQMRIIMKKTSGQFVIYIISSFFYIWVVFRFVVYTKTEMNAIPRMEFVCHSRSVSFFAYSVACILYLWQLLSMTKHRMDWTDTHSLTRHKTQHHHHFFLQIWSA